MRVGPSTATRFGAVDGRRHPEVEAARAPSVGQFVGGYEPRSERAREVLALRRPETNDGLLALQVAGGPVVEDRVPADRLLSTFRGEVDRRGVDDGGHLQLVVQL